MWAHQRVINFLDRQWKNNKLSSAYIFSGPEFLGKKKTALYLAEKILGRPVKEADNSVQIISSIKEDKKNIGVEGIRDLIHQMSLGGNETKRIFIIEKADELGIFSQNALLKSLEEPRGKSILILLTRDEKKLLPTIISRCQKIKFSPLSNKEMEEIFARSGQNREMIEFWSFGRPGLAEKLLKDSETRNEMKEFFDHFKLLFQGHAAEKFNLAQQISQDKEKLLYEMELWVLILRKSLLELDERIKVSKRKAFSLIEELLKAMELIRSTNSSPKLILENLFLKF